MPSQNLAISLHLSCSDQLKTLTNREKGSLDAPSQLRIILDSVADTDANNKWPQYDVLVRITNT